jgi:hypothetical protein
MNIMAAVELPFVADGGECGLSGECFFADMGVSPQGFGDVILDGIRESYSAPARNAKVWYDQETTALNSTALPPVTRPPNTTKSKRSETWP